MTRDSVRVLENEYVHRLHSHRSQNGKLHKGQTPSAISASIPSRYQTVVIDNSDKKGFMSNSKRFSDDLWLDDKPGPGTYLDVQGMESHSASYSKRGTGTFASKNSRMPRSSKSLAPAPNSYNIPMTWNSGWSDFNRSSASSMFQPPIVVKQSKSTGPAPNQYDVLKVQIGRANNVHAAAAFKSKTKREIISVDDEFSKPSPCQYNVSASLDNVRVPMSSFKSKSSRQFPPPPSKNPGPGQYRPHEPVVEPATRTLFPRHHYLLWAAPAISLPAQPPTPGPGSYDVHGTFDRKSKSDDVASAAFVATSRRWSGETTGTSLPGPGHYNPVTIGKQSFIYNSASRWL